MSSIEGYSSVKVTRKSWREFFDSHASNYMKNSFTAGTLAEVDFLLDELKLLPATHILDVGCGTGRHAVELARRGYRVTGVDISANMLSQAKIAAANAGVTIEWVEADATRMKLTDSFDAAICLCEGAFSLFGVGDDPIEHDTSIIRNISSVLKPQGRLVLTAPNAFRKIRQISQEDVNAGRFDLGTLVETVDEIKAPEGSESVRLKQKYYTPLEIVIMLNQAGLLVDHVWGGTAGHWARRKINLDEMEFMATATKIQHI